MRISDVSSDVCASDLSFDAVMVEVPAVVPPVASPVVSTLITAGVSDCHDTSLMMRVYGPGLVAPGCTVLVYVPTACRGRVSPEPSVDPRSVGLGRRVSGSGDVAGCRIVKKKK